ncbi:recombination protein RecR [Leptospira gomenensis]|uniref:Recombination protein RecR n=1 Tax=Leptospira gomenensis TaxID=2484974 RepID=A0A5F1YPQ9_9LEPT|nr:recombination mediator RecR [Leptospira gomenensis]TGK27988.1 recombination protein RecR [Leptospira gomenensis]TGK37157.1 recombination protein RecR [Leptospira gomenensis]TGK45793.1 recombination protein RecR [Leptospira gomenensis]TGK59732.1 recombination protein RecR [Leptospira gomenensis]
MANHLLEEMVDALSSLPGIGRKSAFRISFHLLRLEQGLFHQFIRQLTETKSRIQFCKRCGSYSETEICDICTSEKRDSHTFCVVEQPEDIFFIENTKEFQGKYHVLNGVISPLEGIGPRDLRIKELLERIEPEQVQEVLIATNPTLEGDATADYLANQLKPLSVNVTRIAYGITVGGSIELSDQYTLGRAIRSRLRL